MSTQERQAMWTTAALQLKRDALELEALRADHPPQWVIDQLVQIELTLNARRKAVS